MKKILSGMLVVFILVLYSATFLHASGTQNSVYSLPVLSELGKVQTTTKMDVFTGPDYTYYRSASGKARIDAYQSVPVYGKEGDFLLVSYAVAQGVVAGNRRFGFIYNPFSNVPLLELAYLPISIDSFATIIDEPNIERTGYNTITRLDRENAYALARIIDSSGRVWVYIETNGLDTTDNYITKPVRGFVLASMVFFK